MRSCHLVEMKRHCELVIQTQSSYTAFSWPRHWTLATGSHTCSSISVHCVPVIVQC